MESIAEKLLFISTLNNFGENLRECKRLVNKVNQNYNVNKFNYNYNGKKLYALKKFSICRNLVKNYVVQNR